MSQNAQAMVKILANDGLHPEGIKKLEAAGFFVETNNIPQEELQNKLSEYEVLLVRSATKVRQDLIDNHLDTLKFIGRGGVGMDNIDVEYARGKGVQVENTPAASSQSVAELVMAHMYGMVRSLQMTNRQMPENGATEFKALKKKASKGCELQGKTLGVVGFGRIGQATASIALGCGMKVIGADKKEGTYQVPVNLHSDYNQTIELPIEVKDINFVIENADFISFHIPGGNGKCLIGADEFAKMKEGVGIVNAARGGVIDEDAFKAAIESGKIAFAGLDVFENEPTIREDILSFENVSLSPHIGAATAEAQARIGIEMADKIIEFYKNK